MKAFIPFAESEEAGARTLAGIRDLLAKEHGAALDGRQAQSLRYDHRKSGYHAAVGHRHALNGESVIAILYDPDRDLYHVCTPSRGAGSGAPILVGGWAVGEVVWFD